MLISLPSNNTDTKVDPDLDQKGKVKNGQQEQCGDAAVVADALHDSRPVACAAKLLLTRWVELRFAHFIFILKIVRISTVCLTHSQRERMCLTSSEYRREH